MVSCEKPNALRDSTASRTTFSKAEVEVVIFCMTVSISNKVVKEFGPPRLYDSFSSMRFVDNHLCTAVLMFCHSRLKSGL